MLPSQTDVVPVLLAPVLLAPMTAGVGLGEALGDGEGLSLGVGDGLSLGEGVGESLGSGLTVGSGDGLVEASGVGLGLTSAVGVGDGLGSLSARATAAQPVTWKASRMLSKNVAIRRDFINLTPNLSYSHK